MKNLNVLLVGCCIFYVGTAFANAKRDLPAQVTSPHALNRTSLPPGSLAPISWVGGQSGERNRCPLTFVAYGQQETDPTWFDPWPSNKGVIQSRRQGNGNKNHRKTVSTPPDRHKTAVRHFVKVGQKELDNEEMHLPDGLVRQGLICAQHEPNPCAFPQLRE